MSINVYKSLRDLGGAAVTISDGSGTGTSVTQAINARDLEIQRVLMDMQWAARSGQVNLGSSYQVDPDEGRDVFAPTQGDTTEATNRTVGPREPPRLRRVLHGKTVGKTALALVMPVPAFDAPYHLDGIQGFVDDWPEKVLTAVKGLFK